MSQEQEDESSVKQEDEEKRSGDADDDDVESIRECCSHCVIEDCEAGPPLVKPV